MIPLQSLLLIEVTECIEKYTGRKTEVTAVKRVGGGSINDTWQLKTTSGNFFLKLNDAVSYPGMFELESKGLKQLMETEAIEIPAVIGCGIAGNQSYLLLQWIESTKRRSDFYEDFGNRLAALHRISNVQFGLDYDNYIGSLKQQNKWHDTFIEFFIIQRLEAMLKPAIDNQRLPVMAHKPFEKLYSVLAEIIPSERPALLHGDLWSGNYMTGSTGSVCVFDPAIYFGHREADLAMTLLFGGFNSAFYEYYHAVFPLEKGWRERTDILNLYPLLVHTRLFGGGYAEQVLQIVRKFN
ncbi:MAG: fructosamine kinase family protein [Bacteroidia bacterium]|nr:fructosamine kinase family protein [Bacteroidia bacterium]MCZ2276480.1 fructosamine kinase family protein [Bacteroidia bacterium]